MLSVNTNAGAMVALQNLNSTNRELAEVQSRINTGLKIAGPKDDGSTFAIAQNIRSEISGIDAVKNSLDRGVSATDTAIAAGQSISDLLIEMKEKSVAATDASLDTASRNALDADFAALRDQIGTIVSNAEFDGINLIDGSISSIAVLANDEGSSITVSAQQLSANTGLSVASVDLSTATNAAAARSAVNAAIETANARLASLGTDAKSLEIHKDFVGQLQDTLTQGLGNLVDADLAKESARLQSLQIKQQLGTQALSIANQAPQSILGLF
ncbi:flagellin [Minwuia thermotolerans]|uniref:Flagellin n=1 Tax=Minwuia thermotolerans TaxID=2056226 RepID=A0A2M9G020_9PROT|nr:flagellin [Minwuia thermotolerans]PJK29071.1 flagellin [Minwuia thermotolerans]